MIYFSGDRNFYRLGGCIFLCFSCFISVSWPWKKAGSGLALFWISPGDAEVDGGIESFRKNQDLAASLDEGRKWLVLFDIIYTHIFIIYIYIHIYIHIYIYTHIYSLKQILLCIVCFQSSCWYIDVGTCHRSLAVDYCPECNVEHSLVFGVFTTAGKGIVKGGPPNSYKTTSKIRRGDTIVIFWYCHPTNENRWKHIRYFFSG